MNKEALKKDQPTVYRILSNALKYNRLSHAYLFVGPKDEIKQQTALLFAQSLICKHSDEDGFACQCCDSCTRLAKGESFDFRWIPKKGNTKIKKEDITGLQEFFTSTSAQEENRKVYVLDQFDTATSSASNSLLKSIEEPIQDLYGILIADEKANILSTILSRCQIVTFMPASTNEHKNRLAQVMDLEDAEMLSRNGYPYEKAVDLVNNEIFKIVKEGTRKYMEYPDSMDRIYYLSTEVFIPKSDRMDSVWVRIFLQLMLFYLQKNDI